MQRGVSNVGELLMHLPRSWIDDREITPIARLKAGHTQRLQGAVLELRHIADRAILSVADDSGTLQATFFHARYLLRDARLQAGQMVTLRGEVSLWRGQLQMTHPEWQAAAAFKPGLYACYPTLAGKGERSLRRLIQAALRSLPIHASSPLDDQINGPTLYQALHILHQPEPEHTPAQRQQALWRIKQEELWVYRALLQQRQRQAEVAACVCVPGEYCEQLLRQFPAALTEAQQQAWQAIARDLQSGQRMHRLLQGDVGSGKTWLAGLAACCALQQGQVAIMAPTAVLAKQHFDTISAWLQPLGISLALLTGSTRATQRKKTLNRLASGDLSLVIGTHALIAEDVCFQQLVLAIMDEQHRFGVRQRWALTEKGEGVHLLAMTATPIPRSLAMALYGDLQLTVMQGMPPGRKPVETRVLKPASRLALAAGMQRIMDQGGSIYWIAPRIDDDDASVEQRLEALRERFPDAHVLGLHGRMKAKEKQQVLDAFASGQCRLLVATTVVEVGVNIPQARLIVIERAEGYGLAQLHQLRGRVGRSIEQGYCILLPSADVGPQGMQRLAAMRDCHDGMQLAETDLRLRGAGDCIGVQQSGAAAFRVLDPEQDALLIQSCYAAEGEAAQLPAEVKAFWRPVAGTVD